MMDGKKGVIRKFTHVVLFQNKLKEIEVLILSIILIGIQFFSVIFLKIIFKTVLIV